MISVISEDSIIDLDCEPLSRLNLGEDNSDSNRFANRSNF